MDSEAIVLKQVEKFLIIKNTQKEIWTIFLGIIRQEKQENYFFWKICFI